jgi:acyl carrier protein
MTTYVNGPHNDELEIRMTHERVVAEIVRAITICTSCSGRELNGETNLALDLGLESMSRVELLAEVESALDINLGGIEVAVFAELTIAELADIIMPAFQEDSTDRLWNLA